MNTFDKVSMFNNIEVREKSNGSIIFWNINDDIQLTAIKTVNSFSTFEKPSAFGEYLLFHEDRKDLSKFLKNKSELLNYIKSIWGNK
mgnify:FL=1